MKKWKICAIVVSLTGLIHEAYSQQISVLKKTVLTHYPSASAIEFYNHTLYVIGDDATSILLLDKDHQIKDSLLLFPSPHQRIPKEEKADLEAMAIVLHNQKPSLIASSSFSTATRNTVFFLPLENIKNYKKIQNKKLGNQLNKRGLTEPNLEGLTALNNKLLAGNRANRTHPQNHLLLMHFKRKRLKVHATSTLLLTPIEGIAGLSGLSYVPQKDILFFTASSEDTDNAYTDGTIGESYIGYITNVSQKLNEKIIVADELIPLTNVLNSGLQKIESICIESYQNEYLILHLAADNDNGQSTLFRLSFRF